MTQNTQSSHTMGSMKTVLQAEILKGRRTASRKIALIAPLPFCLMGMLAGGLAGGGAIGAFSTVGWNYWYALMLPVAIALMVASIANIDARQKLHTILGLPLPPAQTWWAKTHYALILVLATNMVVLVASVLVGFLGGNAPSLVPSLATVAVLVIGSAWMIPVGLFLTTRFGTLVGIAVPAVVQLGLSIALWTSDMWFLFPPATTLCAASPFTGVAPSGVPLEAGDPLGVFGGEAVIGLVIAAVVCGVLSIAGAVWFSKKEAS